MMRYYKEGTPVIIRRIDDNKKGYRGIIVGAPLDETLPFGQAYIVKQIDFIPTRETYSCINITEACVDLQEEEE
jgi:hypothetical protein